MVEKLPMFGKYFVDVRLKQFRKVNNQKIEFIDFESIKGEKLLGKYIKTLDSESKEFKRLLHYF